MDLPCLYAEYSGHHVRKIPHVLLYPMNVERTHRFVKAIEVNLMENENNKKKNEKIDVNKDDNADF